MSLQVAEKHERILVTSPATGERLGEVEIADPETVRQAVGRARAAQKLWGALPVKERTQALSRWRAQLIRRKDELVDMIVREAGKPPEEALLFEVGILVDLLSYFIRHAPRILAAERVPLHMMLHRKSVLEYVPRGVVGIISPWNIPLAIPFDEAAMALFAGNAAVIKPSEVTPLTALLAKRIYDESGMPPDLLQVIPGRAETGRALIDGGIDFLIFTGSTTAGKKVAVACAERLIPSVLELGGKAPALVCADAPLDRTARALVWGAFANAGQLCVSVERAYVHASIHDALVAKVTEATRALRVGVPGRSQVDCGAMTWAEQVRIVEARIEDAVKKGAQVLVGGKRKPGPGQFFEPTVLVNCTEEMDVMRQEIFGPVLPIMKIENEEQGLRLSNDHPLGLMAYVFSGDRKKGLRLASQMETGMVMVNDVLHVYAAPETPWGGIKQSGFGRTHSDQGLRDLCHLRHVNTERFGGSLKRDPYWYPYRGGVYRGIWNVMKLFFWR